MKSKLLFPQRAFTLVELLVVVATIAILGCLMLPVTARTRIRSTSAGCLASLKQMQIGAEIYKDDNADILLPNAPIGTGLQGWCNGSEDWNGSSANTNPATYLTTLLSPYINNDIKAYKCPGDVLPSANGPRIRSRSMNSQMGAIFSGSLTQAYDPGWQTYSRMSDLVCPTPAKAWIFCDESMASLNDGYLQMDLTRPDYPDIPAAYHDGAGGFSFADGHAEIHKWQWAGNATAGLINVPYRQNYTAAHWGSSGLDNDWQWLRTHSACIATQ